MCLLLLKEIGQRIPAEAHSSSTFRPSFAQKGEWATGTLLQGHRNMVRRPETWGQLHFCHRSEEHHPMKLLQNYFHRLITKGNKEPLGCKWCILTLQKDRLKKKKWTLKNHVPNQPSESGQTVQNRIVDSQLRDRAPGARRCCLKGGRKVRCLVCRHIGPDIISTQSQGLLHPTLYPIRWACPKRGIKSQLLITLKQ